MSTTNALAAESRARFVDVECHVLPLLDAIEWMARASYKFADLDAMAGLGGVATWWAANSRTPVIWWLMLPGLLAAC
jgi:hypothetical protein